MSTTSVPYKVFLTFVSVVSFAVISAPVVARAQAFESVGVRAQGMGGAFVAVADDASATWWNPAGLASGAYLDAQIEYGRPRRPADTSIKGLAVGFPALGFSYYRLPINQMRQLPSTAGLAESRQDQGVLSVYGISAGQSLGDRLVLASTLKLERAHDTHADVDIGALARFRVMRLGLVVKNVRKPTFATADGPLQLDRYARAGVALRAQSSRFVNDLALALDADLMKITTIAGDERRVAGGLEVWTFSRALSVRLGASTNTIDEPRSAIAGGASVVLLSGAYLKSYLDAQVTRGSDEARRGWGIALRLTF